MKLNVIIFSFLLSISQAYANDLFSFKGKVAIDKTTGLVWSKDAALNGKTPAKEVMLKINKLNSSKYAGYNNWRMPTCEELERMHKMSKYDGEFNTPSDGLKRMGFVDVQPGEYFCGTPYRTPMGIGVRYIDFGNNKDSSPTSNQSNLVSFECYIWPVRK